MRIDEQVRKRAQQPIQRGDQLVEILENIRDPDRPAALRDYHGWLASAQNISHAIYPDLLNSCAA